MTRTMWLNLPKGNKDTIETVEARQGQHHPQGVYDLLIDGEPGRLLIDFSQFAHTEEDERKLISAVRESLYKYHRKPLNRKS